MLHCAILLGNLMHQSKIKNASKGVFLIYDVFFSNQIVDNSNAANNNLSINSYEKIDLVKQKLKLYCSEKGIEKVRIDSDNTKLKPNLIFILLFLMH